MSAFERYLTLWVALAMIAGIALGNTVPGLVNAIAAAHRVLPPHVHARCCWRFAFVMRKSRSLRRRRSGSAG